MGLIKNVDNTDFYEYYRLFLIQKNIQECKIRLLSIFMKIIRLSTELFHKS